MSTPNLDQVKLAEAYATGVSAAALAREHGVSRWTITARLRKAGVTIRSSAKQGERVLEPPLTDKFTYRELVDGLLLGDGSCTQKANLRLEQSDVRFGWLEQVAEHLRLVGATCSFLPRGPKKSLLRSENRVIQGKPSHLLYTPVYQANHVEKARWYPEGVKRVPPDIRLTPFVVAHWFSGDGSSRGPRGTLVFFTNSFKAEGVDLLVSRLALDLGVQAHRAKGNRPGQHVILVTQLEQAMKLKAAIEPWMPECCQYKLRFVRPKIRQGRFSRAQVRALRRSSLSSTELANQYGVTQTAMSRLLRGITYNWVK